MDFSEINVGNFIALKWNRQERLRDDMIEPCVTMLCESRKDCLTVSSVNIEAALRYYKTKNNEKAKKTMKIERKEETTLIFPLFNRDAEHWSCLFYRVPTMVAYHYDSIRFINQALCSEVIEMLISTQIIEKNSIWREMKSLEQPTGYECGYYVLGCIFLFLDNENEESEPIPPKYIQEASHYEVLDTFYKLFKKLSSG